jgi:ABC-type uncharacterized transport system substrate-binding protein
MASHIGRRKFLAALGGAAVAWPLAASAQQLAKLPTIGFLGSSTPLAMSQWVAAFLQRLRDLDWIEGRTVAIEYRWAEGRSSRAAEIAAEFVRLKVDVIVTYATSPALAAKQATSVIPIVFAAAGDPVGAGLVDCPPCARVAPAPRARSEGDIVERVRLGVAYEGIPIARDVARVQSAAQPLSGAVQFERNV